MTVAGRQEADSCSHLEPCATVYNTADTLLARDGDFAIGLGASVDFFLLDLSGRVIELDGDEAPLSVWVKAFENCLVGDHPIL
jgi:hypothetical protein